MNLEEMSDDELNGELLVLIHGEQVKHWCLSDCEKYIYDCGPIGDQFHKIDLLDYCTDWNATMPIAMSHGVGIMKHMSLDEWEARSPYCVDYDHNVDSENCQYDKDPLRAIVICLIKVMREGG